MSCETEFKLVETTITEVKNRLLRPEEILRAIDTGALYVAGPGGRPQAMVTATPSGSGAVKWVGNRIISPDRLPASTPRMRDLSTVFAGVTTGITGLTASIAAGFAVAYSPTNSAKNLGCALGAITSANMRSCLVANAEKALVGLESVVIGTKVSFRWYARMAGNSHYWVFVDDKPATAAPVQYNAATNYTFISLDVTLPDSGPHVVTVYSGNVGGWVGTACGTDGALAPSDRQCRKIAITGDSFVAGTTMNTSVFTSFAGQLAVRYGYNVLNNGYGGTGYINDGGGAILMPFGHSSRINNVTRFAPDEHIFFGSVNDNSYAGAGVADAVTATIAAYRAAHDCKTTVIGVQPTGTDVVLGASVVTAREIYKACASNPLVDRYFDPLGCADIPAVPEAYTAGVYAPDARVTVSNAVWALDATSDTAFIATEGPLGINTGSSKIHRWRRLTAWLHGTGNVSSGTGTRAVLLGSDNTHYNDAGNIMISATVDSLLRSA